LVFLIKKAEDLSPAIMLTPDSAFSCIKTPEISPRVIAGAVSGNPPGAKNLGA